MPAVRLARLVPSLVSASLLVALALATACDDPPEVKTEERRLALGTTSAALCPSLTVNPPVGTTTVIATVFAKDGQVAVGVPVTFTTSTGSYEDDTLETDRNGQARAKVTTGRPTPATDKNEVTFTATTDNGLTAEKKIPVPATPLLGFSASNTGPAVGASFTMDLNVLYACNIRKLAGGLSWDNSKVHLVGSCTDPANLPYKQYDILNDYDSTSQAQSGAVATCQEVGDPDGTGQRSLTFEYYRQDPFAGEVPVYGTSETGAYIGFKFVAVAEGNAGFGLVGDLVATPAGYGDSYDPAGPYAVDADGTANVAKVTVKAASSSTPATFGFRGRH